MRYNGTNLKEVLEAHKRWLNESYGWVEDDRADLSGADLTEANLIGANLRGADLTEANLIRADLRGAVLQGADLYRTSLCEAYLSGAVLQGADLQGADLRGADMTGADMIGADLTGADLRKAFLRGANMTGADLRRANMTGADLRRANMTGADLRGAENVPYIPMACPTHGAFVGWKKACLEDDAMAIIKLLIPEDAKRSSATDRKCRCDKAQVLEIWSVDTDTCTLLQQFTEARSVYDHSFIYRIGETVTPKEPFCEDRYNKCASGIHFFVDLQEAINY